MTNPLAATCWPVNSSNEIVAQSGTGNTTVVGYLNSQFVLTDPVTNAVVFAGMGGGGGASDIAFSTSIPLTSGGSAYMPQQTVTGALTFTAMASAVRNSLVYLRLVANGTNTPVFTGFKEWGGSLGYDNRAGIVNQVQFYYDGYDTYYTVSQVVGATAIDTTPPTVASAAVANASPTIVAITMSEALSTGSVPATSAFTVTGHTVSAVAISGSVVNLTVTSAFVNGEAARTVTYTQPGVNGVRDLAGNLAASFSAQAITNNVAATDTTAPVLQSATVNGASLVLVYNETLNTTSPATSSFSYVLNGAGAVNPTAASVSGTNVTLTFATAATQGQVATLSYTPGTNSIRDTAGNAAASFSGTSVTNNTPASDTTAPVIQSAAMNGTSLVMTYNEALTANSPTLASLSLVVDGAAGVNPTVATASGTTVTLTFATAVTSGQVLTIGYTAGATAIKDAAGNNAANLTAYSVTNNTAATGSSPLRFTNATTGGTVYYAETVGGDGSYTYTSNGNVTNNVFAAASSPVSDLSLAAGQDGSFSHAYAGDTASTVMVAGLKTGATKPANSIFSTWDCMLQTPSLGGAYITKTGNGANQTSSVLSAAGDVVRLRRAGGAVIAEVARAADLNTWITIATPITSGSTGTLWATFCAQTSSRVIENTRYSGTWA